MSILNVLGMALMCYLLVCTIMGPIIHGKTPWQTFLLTMRNFTPLFWALVAISVLLMGVKNV